MSTDYDDHDDDTDNSHVNDDDDDENYLSTCFSWAILGFCNPIQLFHNKNHYTCI